MEFTDEDKQVLKAAAEVFWTLGVHRPDHAAAGVNFTNLVAKILGPQKPPMVKNAPSGPQKVK